MPEQMTSLPANQATPPASVGRKRGPKSKPLVMTAGVCADRQWRDFREAAYPLLLKFGLFDRLLRDPASGRSPSGTSPLAGLPPPRDHVDAE